MKSFRLPLLISFILLLISACNKQPKPIYLFDGNDLNAWDTYLGIPDPSQEVPGLKRDEAGN